MRNSFYSPFTDKEMETQSLSNCPASKCQSSSVLDLKEYWNMDVTTISYREGVEYIKV